MKNLLKIAAYALGGVAVLAALAAAYISISGIPNYPYRPTPEITNLKVAPDSTRIARGAKIATLLCNECHRDMKTGNLTGHEMLDMPKEFGQVFSLNITHDPAHGIGAWTDGEIYYFLRTGIRKDGSFAPPYMPKFPLLADEDVRSIIAWLRSDAPVLAAAPEEFPPNKPNFLVKLLAHVVFFPPPLPAQAIAAPDTSNQIAFGKYVADGLCGCYQCHSADFKTMDILVPEKSAGFYGGGNPMLNYEGQTVPTANITTDKETGIGMWTYQQFYDAVKFNKSPRGGALHYPMFPHVTLTDGEVAAVYAYLKTVPVIRNSVARYASMEH